MTGEATDEGAIDVWFSCVEAPPKEECAGGGWLDAFDATKRYTVLRIAISGNPEVRGMREVMLGSFNSGEGNEEKWRAPWITSSDDYPGP